MSRADSRKKDLPYGLWTCADGREVFFNRHYKPIWQRMPGEPPTPANRDEWVPWKTQKWFYNDGHPEKQKVARSRAALAEWFPAVAPPGSQAKIRRQKVIATGEFLDRDDLLDRHLHLTVAAMIGAMGGDRPPLCGACDAALTTAAPPARFMLLRHTGSREQRLTGICPACFAGDRATLLRRLATYLWVEPVDAADLHLGQWGRPDKPLLPALRRDEYRIVPGRGGRQK